MADVMGVSLYKLVNAMAGKEVTAQEIADATANKTFGDVADALTADIAGGTLPIGDKELENGQKFSTPLISYTAAEMATVLAGTAVSKTFDSLDGFVVKDNKIVKYPFYFPIEGENITGLLFPSLVGVDLDGAIKYYILAHASGDIYLTTLSVEYLTDHIRVQIAATQF